MKMHLTGIGHENMDWIHLTQETSPVMGCFEHGNELRFPDKSGGGRYFLTDRLSGSQERLCSMSCLNFIVDTVLL
jgi:hypothetical protein